MKHLLIILSLLLLSSPVIGEETGVLYQYETSSDFVWKTFGDEKVQHKYKGEIKNGKPNGVGILYENFEIKYMGGWKNGLFHGIGTFDSLDGLVYVGEYKKGKRDGQGKQTFPHGEKFVGEFNDGEMWNGQFINGNIISKVVKGELQ